MTIDEKTNYLIEHFREAYLKARTEAIETVDAKYPFFCPCGRIATGLHTDHCNKFQNAVKKEIIKSMKSKLPDEKSKN